MAEPTVTNADAIASLRAMVDYLEGLLEAHGGELNAELSVSIEETATALSSFSDPVPGRDLKLVVDVRLAEPIPPVVRDCRKTGTS
jgi:hypothetical protein